MLQGLLLTLQFADIVLSLLQLFAQLFDLLNVDVPLAAGLLPGHFQLALRRLHLAQQFQQGHFSIFAFADLVLAVVDVDLQFFDVIVEGGGSALCAFLQVEDVLLEGAVFCLELHDVLLQRKHQLLRVIHNYHYKWGGGRGGKERKGEGKGKRGWIYCEYIMGSCWPSERSQRTTLPTPLPKNSEQKMAEIKVSSSNPLLRSYGVQKEEGGSVFEKRVYDWKSIPISNQFHFRGKLYFAVRSRGIKDDNFLVGVIKRTALANQLPMPWKTPNCICYESHRNKGESGLIFEGRVTKLGESIGENDTIKVVVDEEEVEFKSGRKTLASMRLPVGFLNDEILPYVALFHVGDRIEFMHPVAIE